LTKYLPEDNFIDPAESFAAYIKNHLQNNNLLSKDITSNEEFFVSSNPDNFKISSKMFYKLDKNPELLVF
jgi:glutamate racemase